MVAALTFGADRTAGGLGVHRGDIPDHDVLRRVVLHAVTAVLSQSMQAVGTAKQAGGCCAHVFEPEAIPAALDRDDVVAALRSRPPVL